MDVSVQSQWQALSTAFTNDDWMLNQISQSTKNFNVVECIRDLTNHVWTIYACTPIFNYTLDEADIQRLNTDLIKALSNEGIKCSNCSIKCVPLLAYSENDDMAIQVSVSVSNGKLYEAVLVSRATSCFKNKHYISLPVLLCRGSNKLIKTMNKCFEKLFDSSISLVTLSVKEAVAILLIILKNGNFSDDVDIQLKYKCLQFKTSILYKLLQKDLLALWKSMSNSVETVTTTDVLHLFYTELLTNFRRIYGIDLSHCSIKTVKVENNVFNLQGTVKSQVPELFDFLLKHLTQRINFEKRI